METLPLVESAACCGPDCCAEPAAVSADVLLLEDADAVRASVREKYAAVAVGGSFGATTSCCGTPADVAGGIQFIGDDYATVDGYAAGADLGLGCGVPTELAGIEEGQTVLDLGSGAGIDAFVARRIVGEAGRVLGVDMTPEMIALARKNAASLGYGNVEFRLGEIEAVPVEAGSVDVVISNCVLNLVPGKGRAFAETFRVLRPGGHFCVSDVVSRGALPEAVRQSAELYAGCVAGAIDEADYVAGLSAAGFAGVEVVKAREIAVPDGALVDVLDADALAAFRASGAGLWSVTVRGTKPTAA
jgi:arsenite methyltransferase